MNFQAIKVIFVVLILTTGCHPSDKNIKEILIAMPVNENFIYSEDNYDVAVINSKKYHISYRVQYLNGEINKFIKSYPEGPIEYSLDELKNDPPIYKSIQIPFKQKWKIDKQTLFTNDRKQIKLIKLDDQHYKEEKGNRIFITG